MSTVAISLKLDSDLKKRVQEKAAENGISMSAFISLVLTHAVEDFSVGFAKNYSSYDPAFVQMVAESRATYETGAKSYFTAKEAFDDLLGQGWEK